MNAGVSKEPVIPVLTEVVQAPAPAHFVPQGRSLGEQLDAWLIDQLPVLIHETMVELSPRFEQQMLDALMPRLLASLAQWQDDL
ncbi:hypothetical protein HNQ51_002833 [Inhella inkyongensis]|uniref:Uncharacterized protein n=1 Tax=Inhella inkyongensis TaxID=392593 RepID=A0A840S9P9_9BURK|nr:hypothetical protein [Inhella inkyongensis]MBB5205514.1 hypothetical protein [Inhella inkyongensis]